MSTKEDEQTQKNYSKYCCFETTCTRGESQESWQFFGGGVQKKGIELLTGLASF